MPARAYAGRVFFLTDRKKNAMAAKIVLGARPKNFPVTVKVPMLDGTEGEVQVQFVYRTRTEFGKFIDELMDAAQVKQGGQTDEEVKFSMEKALAANKDANADYIMKVVSGWNLEAEFNRANVAQLCDELPGAAMAIMDRYRQAVTDGRLGN